MRGSLLSKFQEGGNRNINAKTMVTLAQKGEMKAHFVGLSLKVSALFSPLWALARRQRQLQFWLQEKLRGPGTLSPKKKTKKKDCNSCLRSTDDRELHS